jgi:hypothetical protein
MVIDMMGNGFKIKEMDKVFTTGQMETNILEIGKMILEMEKVYKYD